jgi:hypothetical protein
MVVIVGCVWGGGGAAYIIAVNPKRPAWKKLVQAAQTTTNERVMKKNLSPSPSKSIFTIAVMPTKAINCVTIGIKIR